MSGISTAEVKELASSRGIKFWYSRDNSAPLINIAIAFKNCGSAHFDETKSFIPDLFISTVFSGCGDYSKEEFQEKINNISAKFHGRIDPDNILFFFRYPKIVSSEAVSLIQTMFASPKFQKIEIEKKKNSLSYFWENYQVAPISWCLNILLPQLLFKDHPYGNSVSNSEHLLKVNGSDLNAFYKKYIVRNNVELCIFGNISETEAIKLVDQILSSIPVGEKAPDNIPDINPCLKDFTKKYHIEGPQSYVIFTLPHILQSSEQKFAASIFYLILGGDNFKSLITKKLRSESGLIYSGGVYKIEQKHSCFEVGILQTSNKNTNVVIDKIKHLLKNLKEEGISQEDLIFAKSNIKGTFLVGLRTSEDLCYFYIAKKLQGYSIKALEEFLQGIDAVTLEQVNSFARQVIDEKNIPIVVIGGNE